VTAPSTTRQHRYFVVGAGGLLGGAVVAQLRRRPGAEIVPAVVPWHDEDASLDALTEQFRSVASAPGAWSLVWCAGAGVVASGPAALEQEHRVVETFLARAADHLREEAGRGQDGTAFVASSAGGVYAGSGEPPFDEGTRPEPLAPYGWNKLRVEQAFSDWAEDTGVPVVVGRFANIYGPGQDLGKAQGLVSQLCLAHLEGRPSSIYVPMDTIRDYLFVDDAASLTLDALDRLSTMPAGTVVTKIMASGLGITIGALIAELQRVVKRRPRIVWGSHASASRQALDLRFRSIVWAELDVRMLTPVAAGIHQTVLSLQEGRRSS